MSSAESINSGGCSSAVSVTRFGTTADTVNRARAWSANAGPDSSAASATTPIDRPMFPTA